MLWKLAAGGSGSLKIVAKIFCQNLTLNTGESRESPTGCLMWRRGSGVWTLRRILIRTGESSVVDFVLFVPEAWMTRVWWATAWHSSSTSLTWKCKLWAKSTANFAKSQMSKKWKSSDKQSHYIDNIWPKVALNKSEEWNWEDTNLKYWHETNTSQGNQEIRLYSKPPQRWPNRGRRVKRL